MYTVHSMRVFCVRRTTYYILQNVQYATEHIALCTVSHNAMQPSISHVMNEVEIIAFVL